MNKILYYRGQSLRTAVYIHIYNTV